MKKHLNNKSLVAGLIGLLFVVSFVQTAGILNISRSVNKTSPALSQKAQVATLGTCLQVTPWNNRITTYQNFNNTNIPGVNVDMYWNVKNTCPWEVRIIRTTGLGNQGAPYNMELQLISGLSDPFALNPTTFATHGVTNYAEDATCMNCSGNISYNSTVAAGYPTIYTYLIPSQATRLIRMRTYFNKNPAYPYELRVAPKSIKWVQSNAWSDNNISSNEIFTSSVSTANVSNWASDFINMN